MDPTIIIKALNVAVLVITGGALYVFWRSSNRQPFLLHWSAYEFALAAAVIVDGHLLPVSLVVGIAVPVLLLGVLGYRQKRTPPTYAFVLLFLAIALPGYGLAEIVGKTEGLVYLTAAIALGYGAAAALFFREGGLLNIFIAATFLGRTANILLYPYWETQGLLYISYGAGQVLTLAGGVGLLMAGFAKAYGQVKKSEQELIHAYQQSEELMLRLELRSEEYLQARLSAEAANTAKTQFLANMSHELRTPLNAILGFSEVLQVMPEAQAREKAKDYAHSIHEAASGLQAIIVDILNLSRVETGALEMELEACDLSTIVAEVHHRLLPLAEQKDIVLEDRCDGPCLALCDRRLTRQALLNGVTNAIKYTQRGGSVICATAGEAGYAVVTVEDNGIGIEESRLAKVFEPFWQEGNSFVAENTGVGLGLSIAKSYVEAQKGRIDLRPAEGRGTVFRIRLPLAEATPSTAEDAAPAPRGSIAS